MPVQALNALPDGSDIFIDANIFVYGLTQLSTQCFRLLERFMLAEALKKGFITKESDWKTLAKQPGLVLQLHDYWTNTERVLKLNLLFIATDEAIIRRAHPVRQAEGLLTNDSMIVAFMQHHGVSNLATCDGGFDHVAGVTVFRPDDLQKP